MAPEVPDGQSHNLSPSSTRAARASPSNSITSSVSDIEAAASFSGADGLVHSWTLRFLSADVEALYLRHLGVYDRQRERPLLHQPGECVVAHLAPHGPTR